MTQFPYMEEREPYLPPCLGSYMAIRSKKHSIGAGGHCGDLCIQSPAQTLSVQFRSLLLTLVISHLLGF